MFPRHLISSATHLMLIFMVCSTSYQRSSWWFRKHSLLIKSLIVIIPVFNIISPIQWRACSIWCKPQGMSILQPVCLDQFIIACCSGGTGFTQKQLNLICINSTWENKIAQQLNSHFISLLFNYLPLLGMSL